MGESDEQQQTKFQALRGFLRRHHRTIEIIMGVLGVVNLIPATVYFLEGFGGVQESGWVGVITIGVGPVGAAIIWPLTYYIYHRRYTTPNVFVIADEVWRDEMADRVILRRVNKRFGRLPNSVIRDFDFDMDE